MSLVFSIVTCTWNSEPYLADCIDSVLKQDYPLIEWIFVDGGSNDGTLERIRSVPHPYRLLENVRGGISNAMNAGLRAASGDIVIHLHSDDYLHGSDVLTRVAGLFQSSGCQWLFGRTLALIGNSLYADNYVAPRFSYASLLRRNFIPHTATFVRRELMLQAGGFDTRLKYAMDYDMWLKLADVSKPLQLDEPLAVFREHSGSLSTRERMAAMEEEFQIRLNYAGGNILAKAIHHARYFVRRQRTLRQGETR
jgi:glycosyltransferase involved in cell wall biosynthesis